MLYMNECVYVARLCISIKAVQELHCVRFINRSDEWFTVMTVQRNGARKRNALANEDVKDCVTIKAQVHCLVFIMSGKNRY